MNSTYVIVDLFDDGPYSKLIYDFNVGENVTPFIISQHIYRMINRKIKIDFCDLYDSINFVHKKDNRVDYSTSKYSKYLITAYTENDVDFRKYIETYDLYENDIIPFSYYTVNDDIVISTANIFNDQMTKYLVINKIVEKTKTLKNHNNCVNESDTLLYMLEKHDHFKYENIEVIKHYVTNANQLKRIISFL